MSEDTSLFGNQPDRLDRLFQIGLNDPPSTRANRGTPSADHLIESVGSWVDHYKLLEVLGEGGMGIVFLAEQSEPISRRVALKIIKLGMDTRQVIGRFEAERQALAMMDHPNIAKVLDAGNTDMGRPYFVMEWVDGSSITTFCDANGLSIPERLRLFMDVCRAIQYAHQKGLIHRDIKPSNILVTMDNEVPVPKVIDFGIAKATQHELTEKTIFTQHGQVTGTPTYMSPEQVEMTDLDIDTRSDVYSLGVLLYELLTGGPPFDAKEFERAGLEAIRKIIQEREPQRPSTRLTIEHARGQSQYQYPKSKIDTDLDWIVMKCLEKDRTRRYATANGLALDIQRHLNSEPVTAMAPSPFYKLRKFAKRNKLACAAGAAVLLSLLLGLALSLNFYSRERKARADSEIRRTAAEKAEAEAKSAQLLAQQEARRATESEHAARLASYTAEMNVAQQAMEMGNMDRAKGLLERHIPEPGEEDLRGFEWRYLWGQTHRELWTIQSETDAICSLSVSPDGRLLATVDRTGMVRLWDMISRKEMYQLWAGGVNSIWVDFSPDGETLVVAPKNGTVFLWDVRTLRIKERIEELPEGVDVAQFAPDGATLALGYHDGTVRVRHLTTGEYTTVREHRWQIKSIAFSADSQTMVTAGRDGRIQIWDYPECRIRHTRKAETLTTYVADVSPDGEWMATARRDIPAVTICDTQTGEKRTELPFVINQRGVHLRFSSDGRTLALGITTGPLTLYNTETWREITTYHHHGRNVTAIEFLPNDNAILTAGDDGTITAWDARPRPDSGRLKEHPWGVTSLMYSPDGSLIAAGAGDGSVTLWEAKSERKLLQTPESDMPSKILPVEHGDSDFFAFSPDGRRIAVSRTRYGKHSVEEWDIKSQEVIKRFPHEARIMSLAYSPDGLNLATGTREYNPGGGTIRFWALATKRAVGPTIHDIGPVESMAYSADGQHLVTESSWTGTEDFKVWDVSTGERLCALTGHLEPAGGNQTVTFSPDGSILATAGSDRKVILWDSSTWQPITTLFGHMGEVVDLEFSPDGTRLASSSLDGVTQLWNLETRQVTASFPGTCVAYAPNGDTLATGGMGGIPFGASAASRDVRLYRAPRLAYCDRALSKAKGERLAILPGAVNKWLLLGPLDAAAAEQITPDRLTDRGDLNPQPNGSVRISDRSLTWQTKEQRSHSFDFEAVFGYHEQKAVVGVSYVESEHELNELHVLVGCDDQGVLYLNGQEVFRNESNLGFRRDQDRVTGIRLNAGRNQLIFRVTNEKLRWAGSVRFTHGNGDPVTGLRVTLFPER